ncbi:hypothetical protein N657DRAFT_30586 [Parathielavia appendiculata]|uniref:Uncharacterized protein n=1 Tax=Parathielavia appendiculata TaxID=2587402 RepID=A0AAN6Z7G5_9PEZI|nr:hypothetical protein N657DRAFT_30586 [Parathielavia appendiculata]
MTLCFLCHDPCHIPVCLALTLSGFLYGVSDELLTAIQLESQLYVSIANLQFPLESPAVNRSVHKINNPPLLGIPRHQQAQSHKCSHLLSNHGIARRLRVDNPGSV